MHLTLEQINTGSGSGNKFFEQQGGFVENLSLNYEADWWSVIGGKYGPNFSIAYDAAPGIGGACLDTGRVVDEETEENASSETESEFRFVAAAQYGIDITDDIAVTPLVEYVHFWNGGGFKDEDRDYLTAATLFTYRNWNLAVATTQKWVEPSGGGSFNDNQWQVSAGYEFDFGLTLDVGWKYQTEEGINTRTLGALATYTIEF